MVWFLGPLCLRSLPRTGPRYSTMQSRRGKWPATPILCSVLRCEWYFLLSGCLSDSHVWVICLLLAVLCCTVIHLKPGRLKSAFSVISPTTMMCIFYSIIVLGTWEVHANIDWVGKVNIPHRFLSLQFQFLLRGYINPRRAGSFIMFTGLPMAPRTGMVRCRHSKSFAGQLYIFETANKSVE